MLEVSLREFLRNYKSHFPLPSEGIKIISRDGDDFYVCPNKPETESSKLRLIAQFIVQEMETTPLAKPEPAQVVAQAPAPVIAPVQPAYNRCEAKLLLPWETTCNNLAQKFLVANTQDGEPMTPSDWKPVFLCAIHKGVVQGMGGFEIETP